MSSFVVTGADGFLGSHLCRMLAASGSVTAIGRRELTGARLDSIAAPTAVFHCAGGSSVARSLADPARDFDDTAGTLVRVLETMRTRWPGAALVYPSSAAVYGAQKEVPISEGALSNPVSPYGWHKRIAEELCRSYGVSFGTRSVVVRFFSVYGPGQKKLLLWDACRKASDGDDEFAGTGVETRDWLHVSDACALLIAAADEADPSAPVFNGGSGTGTSVRNAVTMVYAALGIDRSPKFAGAARSGDPAHYVADLRRTNTLAWEPRVELTAGIVEYAKWFREARG